MRRPLYVAGAVLIGWGGYGLMTAARHPKPVPWLTFFVGSALAHDLIVAPLVVVVGVLAVRLVGATVRPYLASGLVISGIVALLAFPLVRGYGRRGDNLSIQPLDYTRGLLITLTAVWLGIAAVGVAVLLRRRLHGAAPPAQ